MALYQALDMLVKQRILPRVPLRSAVAAISVGIVGGDCLLDLCYQEDFGAQADFNVVMTDRGEVVELQGAAEAEPFPRQRVDQVLSLASAGVEPLFRAQRQAISSF